MDLTNNKNVIQPSIELSSIPCDNNNFKSIVADFFKTKEENLAIFSCLENSIFSLLHSLDSRHLYLYAPINPIYEKVAIKLGYSIEYINRFLDLESSLIPNSIIIFANPSQPEGQVYDLDRLVNIWEESNTTVIIDESHLSFTKASSFKNKINTNLEIYIIEALEYFYAIEDFELCLIHSSKQYIHKLYDKTPTCHMAKIQAKIFIQMIQDKSFSQISRGINILNKELLIQELSKISFIKEIYPSDTNYILIRIQSTDIKSLNTLLQEHNIQVLECDRYQFLDHHYGQITIQKNKDIRRIINIFNVINM